MRRDGRRSMRRDDEPPRVRPHRRWYRRWSWKRWLVIGFASGDIPKLPANHVLLRNRRVTGVDWGGWAGKDPAAFVGRTRLIDNATVRVDGDRVEAELGVVSVAGRPPTPRGAFAGCP